MKSWYKLLAAGLCIGLVAAGGGKALQAEAYTAVNTEGIEEAGNADSAEMADTSELLGSAESENGSMNLLEVTEILDAEGLFAMAKAPFGNYRLMADIDMAGQNWIPVAFGGSFDGNGYAILNLEITGIGEGIEETFDGNMKVYDTSFAGFFDTLKGASVKNLTLINERIDVDTESPCFIGGIAGYMEGSSIEDCSVQGILQLKACDRMFGTGGIIGYGCGDIHNTQADVTLVCIDTDATTKDEQFMGGVCAAGYPNIKGCTIKISGFDSDHGYVHDGGLVGMYMFYPKGTKYYGSITDNDVTGKITFFEDNKNRRAYCTGFIGEIMNWDFENGRNKADFVRDEVFAYEENLLPHNCQEPVWEETVAEPLCDRFGYTAKHCSLCGYEETDTYRLKEHKLQWTVTKEPTVEETGVETGKCELCEYTILRELEKLEPPATPEPELTEVSIGPEQTPQAAVEGNSEAGKEKRTLAPYLVLGGVLLMFAAGILGLYLMGKNPRKKQ